jgi:hypothetical protein
MNSLGSLDERTALRLTNLLGMFAREDGPFLAELTDTVLAFPSADARRRAVLALGRCGCPVAQAAGSRLENVIGLNIARMRDLAAENRSELLRSLALEAHGLTIGASPSDLEAAATAVHEICLGWNWPVAGEMV